MYDQNLETAIETDASSVGIGAVLMQKHQNYWFPVQFASRTLNDAEKNYSQIEREALSVIFGCEKFRQFLLGSYFVIKNDHKPLQKLFAHHLSVPVNCSARIQRWALRLSQFKYKFEYIKGVNNVNSDFLSRLPLPDTVRESEPYELIFVLQSLNNMPISCSDIKSHTDNDKDLCLLKECIRFGFPSHIDNPNLSVFKSFTNELSIMKGCIMYKSRVFIPESLRNEILALFHDGHPGICAMKSLARSLIWYPGIDNDITNVVKNCNQCLIHSSKPPQNQSLSWPKPARTWSRLHIDHFFFENKICLLVIDALSKYIECETVKDTSASETIAMLREIFSRNGLPDNIVSDNATSFTAAEFKDFLDKNCIHHITSPPYNPSSNGQAERGVRVIKDLLKKNVSGSFNARLSNILLFYRTTPHSVTNTPPCVALNNRKYVTVKDRVNPNFVPDISKKNTLIKSYDVGDNVLALNLRDGPKWHHAVIVEKLGENVYQVHIHNLDVTWKRHTHQLLPTSTIVASENCNNFNNTSCLQAVVEGASNMQSSLPMITVNRHNNNLLNNNDSTIVNSNNANLGDNVINNGNTNNANVTIDFKNANSNVQLNNNDSSDIGSNNENNNVLARQSTRIRKPVDRLISSM